MTEAYERSMANLRQPVAVRVRINLCEILSGEICRHDHTDG